MPFVPRGPRRRMAMEMPSNSNVTKITVVFNRGTAKEQALSATVVGDDAAHDLAILRVVGVRNAPRPINYQWTPELRETMPVVMFGFPLSRLLDQKKKYSAITVTKGSISSLRGAGKELEDVQLDIDMNPGNSGGPVVDEKGALIGVAYSGVSNTNINFAIPVPKLTLLLQGRIDPPTTIQALTVQGQTQVRILAPASDPFGKLREPVLLYGSADELRMPPQGPQGWEKLAGAKSSQLTIQDANAAATLDLSPPAKGPLKVLAQVSYQTDSGQIVNSEPRTLTLGAPGGPPPSGKPATPVKPPIVAARPSHPPKGEELTKLLADLKSADEATRQRAASILQQAPPRQRREEVRGALQELLTATDPATRTMGVQALAACDPKEAAPALAKLLADETPSVRNAVLKAMKDLKDPRVAEAVAARLPAEPLPAIDVLKAMGPAAEKAVLPYLADKYAGPTRFWTFNLLTEIGTAASLPALEAVQGPDKIHVGRAVEAIRQRTPLTADEWPAALEDIKSPDVAQRTKAVRRIAATPPIEERRADIVSRLEGLLNDQGNDVRIAAVKGLGRWGGQKAIPLLAKRLEGFDPGLHAAIIDVLAEMKGDEAAAAIAKRLPDVHDRGKVTQALKAMAAPAVEKAVLPLLTHRDPFVRTEIVKLLADLGSRDSIAPLEKLASDNNPFYSSAAKEALESVKDRIAESEKK